MTTLRLISEAELDKTSWEILNCMADDSENLEQIYRGVCYEMFPIADSVGKFDYRPIPDAPPLWEVVDRLRSLTEAGLIVPVLDEEGRPVHDRDVPSVLWHAWFEMTPQGRAAWESSDFGA